MTRLNTLESSEWPAKGKPLSEVSLTEKSRSPSNRRKRKKKIALFGHFGAGNFGNESTLQALLCHLRRLTPDADVACICTAPEIVAAEYSILAEPISGVVVRPWNHRNPLARLLRKVFVGVPSELYRWLKGVRMLRRKDVLIIVGTGLLNDAFSLGAWGPYSVFKWSVIAKLCRCQLWFVSIGAGPLDRTTGRFLAKAALSLADFRSYRDGSTMKYLNRIGFEIGNDRVYPDLAFSLPPTVLPDAQTRRGLRPVVGLGLMEHSSMYGSEKPTRVDYSAYIETLVEFVKWLLDREYDIQLLIGDFADRPVTQEFRSLLKQGSVRYDEERIIDEPIASVDDLLKQIATTDFVVATRFHNVLLSLLLNKPSIAISFHHKCSSLMSQMGLSEYCQDINRLNADRLIEQFCDLEKNAKTLKPLIRGKAEEFRRALDEQYERIFRVLRPDCQNEGDSLKAMTTR
jgi:polysaccharide pyruvyl transferase WcaK-like protein